MSANTPGHDPPGGEGPQLDLSVELEHAETAADDIQSHLNLMSKELSAYQLRKRRKGRQGGSGMPALAATFSSMGHGPLPRQLESPVAPSLVAPPHTTATAAPKTYAYHGPTQSIVHESVYPSEEARGATATLQSVETRVDRRRRLLRNTLKRKLRRDRWESAAAGIHMWRLHAGEEMEMKRMQERVDRNTQEAAGPASCPRVVVSVLLRGVTCAVHAGRARDGIHATPGDSHEGPLQRHGEPADLRHPL